MARFDASNAEVLVFTFKEGVLSAVAHDLKLRIGRFTVDVEPSTLKAEFDPASLRVVSAMKDGQEHPSSLSSNKFEEIESNAREKVLETARFPSANFEASVISRDSVVGKLTLKGKTCEVRGSREANTAEFQIDQRDFGIKPFSAMLGALKVKPVITVRVKLPPEAASAFTP